MRTQALAVALAVIAIAAGAVAATNLANFNQSQALNMIRPCVPKPAGTIEITSTSAASATSAALSNPSVFWLKCDTAAYIDTSASSSCTAASGDFPLPADTLMPIVTTPDMRYVCARNVTSSASCWLWECK